MNIDDFIENNVPKKKTSVFDEHIDDINKLMKLNYSQKQVIEFLKSKSKNKKGLSEANLSKYLKKSKLQTKEFPSSKINISNITNENIDNSSEEDLLNLVSDFRKL